MLVQTCASPIFRMQLSRQSSGLFLGGAITQLRSHDNAGANLRFSDLSDVLSYAALRIANQVGNDIGVE